MIPTEFIRRIPKTDLHLHLDGSIRLPTVIELARQEKIELPSYEEEGLRKLVFKDRYANLAEYLQGFGYVCAALRNAENITRVAKEVAEDSIAEGVRYIEVRFAPQLHVHDEFSIRDVLRAAASGLEQAKREHNAQPAVVSGAEVPFEYGIIVCAMRCFNKYMGPYFARLIDLLPATSRREVFAIASHELARMAVELRDTEDLPIVGFDLAGEEKGFPASYHKQAYEYAHSHFMKKTVHAGEAYGPESIFQALTDCHAQRIGHGTFLFSAQSIHDRTIKDPERFVEQLVEFIASERITIEVCLTSNFQTVPSITSMEDHPLWKMIAHNLSVSICTDNRLVSHTSVTRELELVAKSGPISPHQFRNLVLAGFKGSFFPRSYNEKRAYVRRVIEEYERMEREYDVVGGGNGRSWRGSDGFAQE